MENAELSLRVRTINPRRSLYGTNETMNKKKYHIRKYNWWFYLAEYISEDRVNNLLMYGIKRKIWYHDPSRQHNWGNEWKPKDLSERRTNYDSFMNEVKYMDVLLNDKTMFKLLMKARRDYR